MPTFDSQEQLAFFGLKYLVEAQCKLLHDRRRARVRRIRLLFLKQCVCLFKYALPYLFLVYCSARLLT